MKKLFTKDTILSVGTKATQVSVCVGGSVSYMRNAVKTENIYPSTCFVLMLHKACQEHMKGGYKMLLIN